MKYATNSKKNICLWFNFHDAAFTQVQVRIHRTRSFQTILTAHRQSKLLKHCYYNFTAKPQCDKKCADVRRRSSSSLTAGGTKTHLSCCNGFSWWFCLILQRFTIVFNFIQWKYLQFNGSVQCIKTLVQVCHTKKSSLNTRQDLGDNLSSNLNWGDHLQAKFYTFFSFDKWTRSLESEKYTRSLINSGQKKSLKVYLFILLVVIGSCLMRDFKIK